MIINVNNPYFNEIRFQLNPSSVYTNDENQVRAAFGGTKPNPENNAEYRNYKQIGEEIKEALLNVRQTVRDNAAAAAAPKTAVTCPFCGATTIPDASGCCEFCGGAVGR